MASWASSRLMKVVCSENWQEDMSPCLTLLGPQLRRWKVFQCLLLEGENSGEGALRNAEAMCVSQAQFKAFLSRHARFAPVGESNDIMKDSYLILDEQMRFLNCQEGGKRPTESILRVGVTAALRDAGFDGAAFSRRGGEYQWMKEEYAVLRAPACDGAISGAGLADIEELSASR